MNRSRLLVLAAALAALAACGRTSGSDLVVGGLYSVHAEKDFWVVKILAVGDDIVHVRVYKNTFATRPRTVDPASLSMGSIKEKDGFGMGHLPLGRSAFDAWKPEFIMETKIVEDELEGYRAWKGSGGGTFK